MEAFTSFLAVLFTPYLSSRFLSMEPPVSAIPGLPAPIGETIKRYSIFFVMIFLITVILNIPRARRYCLDRQTGESKSWGLENGWKKGLLTGILSVSMLLLLTRVFPLLNIIVGLINSFIPNSYIAAEGIILSLFYLIFYSAIAYPIWGSC